MQQKYKELKKNNIMSNPMKENVINPSFLVSLNKIKLVYSQFKRSYTLMIIPESEAMA